MDPLICLSVCVCNNANSVCVCVYLGHRRVFFWPPNSESHSHSPPVCLESISFGKRPPQERRQRPALSHFICAVQNLSVCVCRRKAAFICEIFPYTWPWNHLQNRCKRAAWKNAAFKHQPVFFFLEIYLIWSPKCWEGLNHLYRLRSPVTASKHHQVCRLAEEIFHDGRGNFVQIQSGGVGKNFTFLTRISIKSKILEENVRSFKINKSFFSWSGVKKSLWR